MVAADRVEVEPSTQGTPLIWLLLPSNNFFSTATTKQLISLLPIFSLWAMQPMALQVATHEDDPTADWSSFLYQQPATFFPDVCFAQLICTAHFVQVFIHIRTIEEKNQVVPVFMFYIFLRIRGGRSTCEHIIDYVLFENALDLGRFGERNRQLPHLQASCSGRMSKQYFRQQGQEYLFCTTSNNANYSQEKVIHSMMEELVQTIRQISLKEDHLQPILILLTLLCSSGTILNLKSCQDHLVTLSVQIGKTDRSMA